MSDKAEQCPKCGYSFNVKQPVETVKNKVEDSHHETISRNHTTNKIVVLVIVLVAIGIGGVCGYFLYPNISTNSESTLYEAETTNTVMSNEDLLKDGSYYWLSLNTFPVVYELKDGTIVNAFLGGYPLEAKISHKEYFKGRNTQTLPNGQKMDLYIQFKLKNGEGYVEQGGSRTNITMYKLSAPSDTVSNIIRIYKNNYEEAMRNVQTEVVDEVATEATVCDSVSVDYVK